MRYFVPCLFAVISLAISSCLSPNGESVTNPGNQAASTAAAPATHWVIQKLQRSYPDGFPSSSQTFEYDKNGRILAESEFNSSQVLVILRKYQYKTDNTVEILTLDPDNTLEAKSIQEYSHGLLMRERLMSATNEVHFTSDFRYDEQGNKIYWGISGKIAAATISEYYYENNRLMKISVSGPNQIPIKHYVRIYDKTGQLEREDEFNAKDVLLNQTFYSWAAKHLEQESVKNAAGLAQSSIVYHYDGAGRPVKLEIYGLSGELQEIQTQEWIEVKKPINGK